MPPKALAQSERPDTPAPTDHLTLQNWHLPISFMVPSSCSDIITAVIATMAHLHGAVAQFAKQQLDVDHAHSFHES